MTYHDDPDLERRLRRIAAPPEPPVPGSVFRYANEVTTGKRGFHMLTSVPRPRPGLMVGLAAVATVLALVAGFSFALRGASTGGPSVEPSVSPTVAPSESPSPSDSLAPSQTPLGAWLAADFGTPGSSADWQGFAAAEPAPQTTVADDSLTGTGVRQVLRWSGGYVASGSVAQAGQTRPSRGLWTSKDGESWTAIASIDAPAVLVSVAPFGLLAIGTNPSPDASAVALSAWTSADGLAWSEAGKPDLPGRVISIAGTDKGLVATVAVETGTLKSARTTYQIEHSSDGLHWTPLNVSPVLAAAQLGAGLEPHVQAGGGHFYLMGSGLSSGSIVEEMWLSDDGKSLTKSQGGYSYSADYIDFGRDGMLLHTVSAGAPGGEFQAYSIDGGITWHEDKSYGPLGQAVCEGQCSVGPAGVIASNGTVMVAVANGGQRAYASYDGHTWQGLPWLGGDPAQPVPGASYGGAGLVVLPRGVLLHATYTAAR